jgi:2-polyprenyl-3-methyl-5-hydroxy-6-metoxy-1,4-benzoquinol methylase
MKNHPVDPKKFWEQKILKWEKGRYALEKEKKNPLLEIIADHLSHSLRFRMEMTMDLLRPHVSGKKVLELGCGSGLLAKAMINAGAESYVGIDITESAIQIAQQRTQLDGIGDQVQFQVGSVGSILFPQADIYLSLGLTDWLTDDQLLQLFQNIKSGANFLHSFSEKRFSFSQWLHRAYVQAAYGWRTGSYIPRYYSADELQQMVEKHIQSSLFVVRNPELSFGAFITSLPNKGGSNAHRYTMCR